MAEALFGTDGFRGPVDESESPARVNSSTFFELARLYAYLAREQSQSTLFVVGSDTRTSSPELMAAVCNGITAAGTEVWDLGVAPTPMIAWVAQKYEANAIAITASHNPGDDNGFKPFDIGGVKPPTATLKELEARYLESANQTPKLSEKGQHFLRLELVDEYIQNITEKIGGLDALADKTVVIDGANGAVYEVAPRLYRALGAEVIEFACSNDGARINQGCGAAHLEGAAAFLAEQKDLAASERFLGVLASDGDGDRVIGLDAEGRSVDGNYWLKRLAVGQVGIVGTIYTNSALRTTVKDMGVEFHECDNGDRYVTAMLQDLSSQRGAGFTRGGEFTGHLIDLNHLSSGDGLYMGAWLAAQLAQEGSSLRDIRDEMTLWPEKMATIRLAGANAKAMLEQTSFIEAIGHEREQLGQFGRIIVRASGTEPLIRVWAEAKDGAVLDGVVSRLSAALQTTH